jgi:hypothetical protein
MIYELPVAVELDAVENVVDNVGVDDVVVDDVVVDADTFPMLVVCIWLPPNFSMTSVILYGSGNIQYFKNEK